MGQLCRSTLITSQGEKICASVEGINVSNIFPVTTDDERDPREDQNADAAREAEIKGDRPPHHGG
jgi:hypothetical protein